MHEQDKVKITDAVVDASSFPAGTFALVMSATADQCVVCGVHIAERANGFAVCGRRHCRKVFLGVRPAATMRAIDRTLSDRLDDLASAALSDRGATRALLPANVRTLEPITPVHRAALIASIRTRLTDYPSATLKAETRVVSSSGAGTDPGDAAIDSVMQEGCATCRGACCTRGGTHAFLTAAGLRRTAAFHGFDPVSDGLEMLYASALPDEHYAASCVFHAERGCALPRSLRSDTCNSYECGGLTLLRRRLEAGATSPVVIGAASWSGIERVAVVEPPRPV